MTFLFCCFSTICTNKYARDGLFIILMYGSNTQNVEFTGGSRRSKSLFYKSIVFIITLWLALTENIYADSRCLNKTLSLGKFISLRWKSWSFEKSGINFLSYQAFNFSPRTGWQMLWSNASLNDCHLQSIPNPLCKLWLYM